MKMCNVCGSQVDDYAINCPVCGAQVAAPQMNYNNPQQQPNPYAQPQQGMYGQPQQAMNDPYAQPQQGMYGQPQMGMNDPYQSAPPIQTTSTAVPSKKVNTAAIICIIVAAVAVLGVGVWFFFLRGGSGNSSPEGTVKAFVAAMDKKDANDMKKLFYPGMLSDSDVQSLEAALSMLSAFGDVKIKFDSVDGKQQMSSSDISYLEDSLKSGYNIDLKIDDAYNVTFTYTISMEFMGQSQSESQTQTLGVMKVKGKWYLTESGM